MEKDCMERLILSVAKDLFLEKGFSGVSTTDIAAKAGCNQALVHYYFRTKSNLFKIVFKDVLSQLKEKIFTSYNSKASFEEKITEIIDVHFSMLQENPYLPMFLMNEISNNKDISLIIQEVFLSSIYPVMDSLQKDLQTEIAEGRVREISVFNLLLDIVSLNLFIFIAEPVMKNILGYNEKERQEVIEERKNEAKKVILLRLKAN
jgi:Transcriptional regulator